MYRGCIERERRDYERRRLGPESSGGFPAFRGLNWTNCSWSGFRFAEDDSRFVLISQV